MNWPPCIWITRWSLATLSADSKALRFTFITAKRLYLHTRLRSISKCPDDDGPLVGQIWTLPSLNLAAGQEREVSQYLVRFWVLDCLKGSHRLANQRLQTSTWANERACCWLGVGVQAIHNSEGSEETQCHNNSSPWHPPWPQSDLREAETSATSIPEKTDQ